MASRKGLWGVELKTTTKGFHCMNPIYSPLASLDQNASDGSHANLHNSMSGEEMVFQFPNTKYADDNLLRAWVPPVEDGLCKEPNDFRYHRTAESGAPWGYRALNTTNMHVKALVSEKENVEVCSARTRSSFSSPKGKASNAQPKSSAGLLNFAEVRRLQEGFDAASQPLSQVMVNILEGAAGGLDVSSGDSPLKNHGGLQRASLQGSQSLLPQRKNLNHNLEGSVHSQSDCSQTFIEQPLTIQAQERINETSNSFPQSNASVKSTLLSTSEPMETSLLRQFTDQSELQILCDKVVVQDNPFLLSQSGNPCDTWGQYLQKGKAQLDHSKTQSIERSSCENTQTCEEDKRDHVVLFFSFQKFLEENAASVNRHKLSKLSSLCALYSRKILCWVTSACKEQAFANYLLRIRQIFSPSRKGFVDLSSQRLPEFSPTMSSPKKKLAKDNELRAVLLKINEVFTSLESNSSDSMEERNRSAAAGPSHG